MKITTIDDPARTDVLDRVARFEELVQADDRALADATAAKVRKRAWETAPFRILPSNDAGKPVNPRQLSGARSAAADLRAEYLAEHAPEGDPSSSQLRLINDLVEERLGRKVLQAEADAASDEKIRIDKQKLVQQAAQKLILLERALKAETTGRRRELQSARPPNLQDYLATKSAG